MSTNAVHRFTYRAPRFEVVLPVEFVVGGTSVPGFTQNISLDGLLVRFDSPVLAATVGKLRLMVGACTIEIAAQIAYSGFREAGVRFRFSSAAERNFVEMLVKVASRNVPRDSHLHS